MKLAATLALLLSLTATAAAGPTRNSAPRKARPAAAAQPAPKPAKSYDFLADEIDGDRIQPDGTTVFGLPDAKRPSLIELRGDFVREIARSAEQL
jgi:hypothetical protein